MGMVTQPNPAAQTRKVSSRANNINPASSLNSSGKLKKSTVGLNHSKSSLKHSGNNGNSQHRAIAPPLVNIIPSPEPNKHKKQAIILAKSLPPDPQGRDPYHDDPANPPIPLSLLTHTQPGPRRTDNGRILPHTVLGDIDDFEHMEKLFKKPNNGVPTDMEIEDDDMGLVDNGQENRDEKRKLDVDELIRKQTERLSFIKAQEDKMRRALLQQMKVFQKYRILRQEHALRNWQRHSVQWAQLEDRLAGKLGRDPNQLLINRLGEYRLLVEERALVEEAVKLMESRVDNFWGTGLRIGNDLLGLTVTMPKGGPRDVERLRGKDASRVMAAWERYNNTFSYNADKKHELRNLIHIFDPFHGHADPGFLEVVGAGVGPDAANPSTNLQTEFVSKVAERAKVTFTNTHTHRSDEILNGNRSGNPATANTLSSESYGTVTGTTTSGTISDYPTSAYSGTYTYTCDCDMTTASMPTSAYPTQPSTATDNVDDYAEQHHLGPWLILSTKRLSFETNTNETTSSVLTVYNRGPTSIYFEWQPTQRTNPLKTSSNNDGVQRFFLRHTKGMILPGDAYDFPVVFKSQQPGLFTQEYRLITSPHLEANVIPNIKFQGLAVEPDSTQTKRVQIEKDLYDRTTKRMALEIIDGILDNVKGRTEMVLPGKRKAVSDDEDLFVGRNKEIKLYYSPIIFAKFEALAQDAYAELHSKIEWDRSAISLYESINHIPNLETRSFLLARLNALVEEASVPPYQSRRSVLYVIGYDLLVELTHDVSGLSFGLRKKLDLPMARPCVTKFTEGDENTNEIDDAENQKSKDDKNGKGNAKGAPPAANNKKVAPPTSASGSPAKGGAGAAGAGASNNNTNGKNQPSSASSPSKPETKPKEKWTPQRVKLESQYKLEFKAQSRLLVQDFVHRMVDLFDDASNNA